MTKRSSSVLAAILALLSCTSDEDRRRIELMDAIENRIHLPVGAGPIARFARTYRFAAPDRVVGSYFTPDTAYYRSSCEEARRGGRTNGQVVLLCPPPEGMTAGERRWFDDDVHLPVVDDGGCDYIDVEYDVRTRTFALAHCHGTVG